MNKPLYLHTLVFCAIINIVDTFFFYCVLPYHLGIIRRCSLACIVLCLDITNTNHLNVEEHLACLTMGVTVCVVFQH